jgi:DNA-binding transcriptional LysR family regulator
MFDGLRARRGLSLDRLAALVSLAEARSLARAARQDPVRQSLLSRQIRELEQFFEVELVARSGRGLALTPSGEKLAKLVRETFHGLEDFRATASGEPLTVRIGAGDSIILWSLLPHLAELQRAQAGIRLSFHNLMSVEISEGLRNLSLDVGVVRDSVLAHPLKSKRLGMVEFRLFVPRALARESTKVTWQAIASQLPLAVQVGATTGIPNFSPARAGAPNLTASVWCDSYPQVARAVSTGQCAGILPATAVTELSPDGFWSVPVKGKRVGQSELAAAWNPRLAAVRPAISKVAETITRLLTVRAVR